MDAGPDADPFPDLPPACATPSTFIYFVNEERELRAFDPLTATTKKRGQLYCLTTFEPFSMAVDRRGLAYILYEDGTLFRVDGRNAKCLDNGSRLPDIGLFGMGFALDEPGGTVERLYAADFVAPWNETKGLAVIDTVALTPGPFTTFQGAPGKRAELTSASDGRLYGYFSDQGSETGVVSEIDPATGQVTPLRTIETGRVGAFAFAWWDGDFYTFTSPDPYSSDVRRWRPADDSITLLTTLPYRVMGAGVSTCEAP